MTDSTIEAPATPRLKQQYKDVIVPELEKEFKYSNPMQVARVQKVVVSMGVGAAARDSKLIEGAVKDLTLITGQKPKITKAKKSVAQFHLREGQAIGAYVTLRGDRMWVSPTTRVRRNSSPSECSADRSDAMPASAT